MVADLLPSLDAEGGVDAVDFDDLFPLDFGPAAGDDDLLVGGALGGQDFGRLARFLAGVVDEAAGVEDDEVGVGANGGGLVAGLVELAGDAVGVGGVLGAAERDDLVLHQPPLSACVDASAAEPGRTPRLITRVITASWGGLTPAAGDCSSTVPTGESSKIPITT